MRLLGLPAVSLVILLSACGSGERACDLLEDLPDRAELATVEDLRAVADAAQQSDAERIRTLGQELTSNLARARALEGLAPGAAVEVLQVNLDQLRRTCRNLDAAG